ncbi:MAG: ABC transporter ATP-binding protein [Alphaproteobacteria bacterium]|nr:ABC transporter ATP-binding protein [Alphaproteobacteria bacterium]
MLKIQSLDIRLGGRLILDQASAQIGGRQRVGLVGRNGAGKTTLLRVLAGRIEPDGGEISCPKSTRFTLVAQDAPSGPGNALETVLAADTERAALLHEQAITTDPLRAAEAANRLDEINAEAAPARAASILAGLGLDKAMQAVPLDSLSGGWRMRVALAAALFADPDLLFLDEPTNHLDLEASIWLEAYLKRFNRTLILVSHDRHFLDAVADAILHLENGKLTLYPGNFERFERVRRERLDARASEAARIVERRAHLQAFVARFRANASKATQAQSRMKALAKLEPIVPEIGDPPVRFVFPPVKEVAPPLIACEDVSLGYGKRTVLGDISFSIRPDDRIALLGANGNGKSTLARFLAGELAPQSGEVRRSSKLIPGHFAQHQLEALDSEHSPFQHLARLMKGAPPERVRTRLGGFAFSGEKADVPVRSLSGGERARLNLALVSYAAPNLLILDEPTNHLDMEARESLVEAISAYRGAVVLVSHDEHLIGLVADTLWLVADHRVRPYEGDLNSYRARVLAGSNGDADERAASRAGPGDKERRRAAAKVRTQLAPLRIKVKAAETRLESLNAEQASLEAKLADPALYAGDRAKVSELNQRLGTLAREIAVAEAAWLASADALEAAQAS